MTGTMIGKMWKKSRFYSPYLRNTLWQAGYALDTLETAVPWANVMATALETLRRWKVLKSAASRVIVAHGGTISHQHGVGLDHAPYLAAEKGPLGMQTLETVCKLFDPDGMTNPGKLL